MWSFTIDGAKVQKIFDICKYLGKKVKEMDENAEIGRIIRRQWGDGCMGGCEGERDEGE